MPLPRAYELPKIHKINHPLRIIISSLNSSLYELALFLHNIMFKNFPMADSHIRNSFDLVRKLNNTHLDNNSVLISLDVISLFTNIPLDSVFDSIL